MGWPFPRLAIARDRAGEYKECWRQMGLRQVRFGDRSNPHVYRLDHEHSPTSSFGGTVCTGRVTKNGRSSALDLVHHHAQVVNDPRPPSPGEAGGNRDTTRFDARSTREHLTVLPRRSSRSNLRLLMLMTGTLSYRNFLRSPIQIHVRLGGSIEA